MTKKIHRQEFVLYHTVMSPRTEGVAQGPHHTTFATFAFVGTLLPSLQLWEPFKMNVPLQMAVSLLRENFRATSF